MSELDDPNTVTVTMEEDGYLSMCKKVFIFPDIWVAEIELKQSRSLLFMFNITNILLDRPKLENSL